MDFSRPLYSIALQNRKYEPCLCRLPVGIIENSPPGGWFLTYLMSSLSSTAIAWVADHKGILLTTTSYLRRLFTVLFGARGETLWIWVPPSLLLSLGSIVVYYPLGFQPSLLSLMRNSLVLPLIWILLLDVVVSWLGFPLFHTHFALGRFVGVSYCLLVMTIIMIMLNLIFSRVLHYIFLFLLYSVWFIQENGCATARTALSCLVRCP